MGFSEVPLAVRQRAWEALTEWRLALARDRAVTLPAPFVFANDDLEIEFEWESAGRQLMLRITGAASLQYLKTETRDGREVYEEGSGTLDSAPEQIAWVLA
jgi:hypothetical protein